MSDEPEMGLKTLKKQDLVDDLYEMIGELNFFIQTDNAIYGEDLVEHRDALIMLKEKLDYLHVG